MKPLRTFLAASALAVALALSACDGETTIGSGLHSLSLRNGVLTAHSSGHPDATVTAAGELSIDGKPVTLTPAQRELFRKYYASVVAIRQAGIETGKAGAKLAGKAVSEVANGLMHGDTDHIDSRVNDQAKEVEKSAMVICDALGSVRASQDAIVASLPAYKPYANVEADAAVRCRTDHEERHDRGGHDTPASPVSP